MTDIHGIAQGENGITPVHDHSKHQPVDPNVGFAKGGLASKKDAYIPGGKWNGDDDPAIIAAEAQALWDKFRGPQGYQTPTPPDDGALAPLDFSDPTQQPPELTKLAKGGIMAPTPDVTTQADGKPVEVPPGALPEEVKDDVPAKLSEGEYTIPADVVRWVGLKQLVAMRDDAKHGLMAMQAEGQIQAPDGSTQAPPVHDHAGFASGGLMGPQLTPYTDPKTGKMGYHYVDASGQPASDAPAAPDATAPAAPAAPAASQMPSAQQGESVSHYSKDHTGGSIGTQSGDSRQSQAEAFANANAAATPSAKVAANMAGIVSGIGSPLGALAGIAVKGGISALTGGSFGDQFNTPGPRLDPDAIQRVQDAYMTGGMSLANSQLEKERELANVGENTGGSYDAQTGGPGPDESAGVGAGGEGTNIGGAGVSHNHAGNAGGGGDAGGAADNGGGGTGGDAASGGHSGEGHEDGGGFARGGLMAR
jgi:hypothetical protein